MADPFRLDEKRNRSRDETRELCASLDRISAGLYAIALSVDRKERP